MTEGPKDDWAWLDALVGEFDEDIIEAVNERLPQQERPELDRFFADLDLHGAAERRD